MGLIGKNGAGKSTTLKAILNMVSPESGSVTMFQKNFYQYEKECKHCLLYTSFIAWKKELVYRDVKQGSNEIKFVKPLSLIHI